MRRIIKVFTSFCGIWMLVAVFTAVLAGGSSAITDRLMLSSAVQALALTYALHA